MHNHKKLFAFLTSAIAGNQVIMMAIELVDMGWLAVALAASLVAARLINFILSRYVKMVAAKTKTTLDDRLLEAVQRPITSLVLVLGAYLALSYLPSFSPYSQEILQAFSIALIAVGAYAAVRLVNAFLSWYAEEAAKGNKAVHDLAPVIRRIATAFLVAIAAMMALSELGIEVTPLLASLGIAGLAVALAFQDTLANFFAGIYITVDRPVRSGDYIKLDSGDEGYVQKIGWRNAMIRQLAGNMILVPNSKLAQAIIINYYLPSKDMAVIIPVSVSYDTDLAKAEKVTVQVGEKIQKTTAGAVPDFKPFIRYSKFADSGIEFSVILRVNEFVDQYLVRHEFIKALHAAFKKEKIEIPYPKRDVYLKRSKG